MNRIVFTGGGTAGHVIPNLPLIHRFYARGWRVDYIGSGSALERDLIAPTEAVYHKISTGKLRRPFTFVSLCGSLRVVLGLIQAFWLLLRLRPTVVFAKGGYVSLPVVVSSWLNRVPVIAHESDLSPGLANRLSYPFVRKICTTFPETLQGKKKALYTGALIRPELLHGDRDKGLAYCGFSYAKPMLLVLGGSQGARAINRILRTSLSRLLPGFQVAHVCGAGNLSAQQAALEGYRQFEFLGDAFPDVLAAASLAVSRAGSNALVELLALRLPHLLIPLNKTASRGDQIENAGMAEGNGWSMVLQEADLTEDGFMQALTALYANRSRWRNALRSFSVGHAVDEIDRLLFEQAR